MDFFELFINKRNGGKKQELLARFFVLEALMYISAKKS